MRVAVTGGRGFIGSVVCSLLRERGDRVVVVDRADGHDVARPGDWRTHVEAADAVVHLAGVLGTAELFERPYTAVDVNVGGTLNVLQACRRGGTRYVGITVPDAWDNVYQATKLASQRLAHAWNRTYDVPVAHVRAFNAFGAGQRVGGVRKIVPTFARAAWQGKPLPVWGDGRQVVDLVHVTDVARLLVRAVDLGNREVIDAGTGVPHTVNEVARLVWERARPGDPALVNYRPMRDGESEHTVLLARGEGWDLIDVPPVFDLEQLGATVDWYRTERP